MATVVVEVLSSDGKWVPEERIYHPEIDLDYNEDTLIPKMCEMGKIMVKYGDLFGQMKAQLGRKEEEVKETYARVSGLIRSESEGSATRMTEGAIKDKTTTDSRYQKALHSLHVTRAHAIQAEAWWRASHKVADLLNSLGYRTGVEYKKMY